MDGLPIGEVKKLIEKSKDRLQLIVSKSPQGEDRHRSSHNRLPRDDEGKGKLYTEREREREREREGGKKSRREPKRMSLGMTETCRKGERKGD